MALKRHHLGVYRIDHDRNGTHAWVAFLQRRGRIFQKCFSDGVYGGRKVAYAAAVPYRTNLARKHPPLTRREYVQIRKHSNRSGHVGLVKYQYVEQTPNGKRVRPYWIATWTPERGGPYKQKKFSIRKYGDRQAFELAKQTREKAIAALRGGWRKKPHLLTASYTRIFEPQVVTPSLHSRNPCLVL